MPGFLPAAVNSVPCYDDPRICDSCIGHLGRPNFNTCTRSTARNFDPHAHRLNTAAPHTGNAAVRVRHTMEYNAFMYSWPRVFTSAFVPVVFQQLDAPADIQGGMVAFVPYGRQPVSCAEVFRSPQDI